MCGVRKFSNFILIFMSEGTLTASSTMTVTTFHPNHQWRSVPLSAEPLQHLLFVECLAMAILTSVMWCLAVVQICISLIFNDVDIVSCDFFEKGVSCTYILKLASLMPALFWVLCSWLPLGHFLRACVLFIYLFIYSPYLDPCEC